MGSSTVKAQKLANEANIQNVRETNDTNIAIAHEANDYNYRMFQEQNAWNREQWNLENEYNSPKQQVQRYLEAGINPIWGLDGGDPGNAQQLTSADAAPAQVPTLTPPQVQPEYDPTRLSNIVGAANNVVNGMQGFMQLALEAEDVSTRRSAQQSQAALNMAEGMFKKSQTAGQDILNNLNSDTYFYQVSSKAGEYSRLQVEIDNLKKEGKSIDEAILNSRATREQIVAQTDYIYQQKAASVEQIAQGWRRLSIEQQNANTASFNAQSSSYYEGENLKQRYREYLADISKTAEEFKYKSNQQLIDYFNATKSKLQSYLGNTADVLNTLYDDNVLGDYNVHDLYKSLNTIQAVGEEFRRRVAEDPSLENIKSFNEWQRSVDSIPPPPSAAPTGSSLQNYGVMNP